MEVIDRFFHSVIGELVGRHAAAQPVPIKSDLFLELVADVKDGKFTSDQQEQHFEADVSAEMKTWNQKARERLELFTKSQWNSISDHAELLKTMMHNYEKKPLAGDREAIKQLQDELSQIVEGLVGKLLFQHMQGFSAAIKQNLDEFSDKNTPSRSKVEQPQPFLMEGYDISFSESERRKREEDFERECKKSMGVQRIHDIRVLALACIHLTKVHLISQIEHEWLKEDIEMASKEAENALNSFVKEYCKRDDIHNYENLKLLVNDCINSFFTNIHNTIDKLMIAFNMVSSPSLLQLKTKIETIFFIQKKRHI